MTLQSRNGWDRYQEARTKVDDFLKKGSSDLKDSLELLAVERTNINKKLLAEWIEYTQIEIPDIYNYVDFNSTSEKLGRAYSRYWHYVFLYRALYENKDNIIPTKVYSFELYFLAKEKVLEKNSSYEVGNSGSAHTNQSMRLFYECPLGHFLFFKFMKEFVSKFAPKPEVAQLMSTGDPYKSLTKIRDFCATHFNDFFQGFDSENSLPDDFRYFIESDDMLTDIFKIIDVGIIKHAISL